MATPARSLIVVPRLPAAPKHPTGNPFTSDGDIVVDCAEPGCGWHAMGPRALIGEAQKDHYRRFHATDGTVGVFKLNHPNEGGPG